MPVVDEGPNKSIVPGRDVVKLTKGGGVIPECRALLVGTAGDLNIVTAAGHTQSAVPFTEGMTPVRITELLAGGAGDDVWAVY